MDLIESIFKLKDNKTSFKKEILAGLATFLTMAYIMVVNPAILSETGMDFDSVFVATILASFIACLLMGFLANWPVALAPGMGLNAFFTYAVVFGMGFTWQQALAAVLCSGILFLIISISPLRAYLINAIPKSLKFGIGAGIGLFLAIIGLKNAGIVVDNPATLVGLGDLKSAPVLLALLTLILMIGLDKLKVPGAIVLSILATTIIGMIVGVAQFQGIVSPIPSMSPTFMQLDFSAMGSSLFLIVVFTILFVDFFDTAGTLTSVANLSGKIDKDGNVENIDKAVFSDSIATIIGSIFGTSSTTSYIESGAGIKEGGKTGLVAVTVGVFFLLCLFLAPLAKTIPAYATGAALVFIATFFCRNLVNLDWDDISEYSPALLAAFIMPLTYSISNGIALAFIVYVLAKVISGKMSDLNPAVLIIAGASLLHFLL
ncbi:NCS2 family permease [Alphaproteobacteria bacterium]|jgi:AGZA family xanthine/uracil permease-like MFS transporter|nr:NCS2 family permease [Alphaproteobacteria bacterium]MDB2636067.1 NCS2 family permease [Alphaproteobacteria bacterium]MDB3863691.1 NCS2 family permease [Alphaproteobacteria bacterium]|tara:strand:- start:357 stop:1649 length:1293 start_codon:yes stop_codon:yes gene_type:complete